MTDKERWAFVIGLMVGSALSTAGWWLNLLMTRAIQ